MKRIFNNIKEKVEWLVFAEWYKGGGMGDGILVTMISVLIWFVLVLLLVFYCFYLFL